MNNESEQTATKSQKKRWLNRRQRRIMVILILIIVLCVAGIGILVFRATDTSDAGIIRRAGSHIMLPTDETPTITMVENSAELSSQPFFANAQDGDKILIYSDSARIIVYRPSANILVNVGPILDDSIFTQIAE